MTDYLSKRGQPYLQGTNRYQRLIGTSRYNDGREACNEILQVDLTDREAPYLDRWQGCEYAGGKRDAEWKSAQLDALRDFGEQVVERKQSRIKSFHRSTKKELEQSRRAYWKEQARLIAEKRLARTVAEWEAMDRFRSAPPAKQPKPQRPGSRRYRGERSPSWEADANWNQRWQLLWNEKCRDLPTRVIRTYLAMAGGAGHQTHRAIEVASENGQRALASYDPRVVAWAIQRGEEWTLIEEYWRAYGFEYQDGTWRVIPDVFQAVQEQQRAQWVEETYLDVDDG